MTRLDPARTARILTLRYDPAGDMPLPDWTARHSENHAAVAPVAVEEALKESIRSYVEAKKPDSIAISLSGGVDSTLVLSLFRELYPDLGITCVSTSFGRRDAEMDAASDMASRNNCDFRPLILDNFLQNLPLQISIVGEPKWHYYGTHMAQELARHASVHVSGDGGDELFGGYVFRYKKFLESVTRDAAWQDRVSAYMDCHNRDWVEDQERMFGPAVKFDWGAIHAWLRGHFENRLSLLEQVFMADYNGKLMHDWIPSWKKIHDHYGISGFQPFLAGHVISQAQRIPPEQKYDPGSNLGKLLLRSIHKSPRNHASIVQARVQPRPAALLGHVRQGDCRHVPGRHQDCQK